MRRASLAVGLALIWSSAGIVRAAPSKPTVEAVLAAFQTEKYLAVGMEHLEKALARRRSEIKVSPDRAKLITDLSRRIYPSRNLYPVFKVAYAKQITLENMTALHTWLNKPDGIKMRRAFEAYHQTDEAARKAYFDKNNKALLKPNRVNALETYVRATKPSELQAAWMIGADLAVRRALNTFLPAAQRESDAEIAGKLASARPGYETLALTLDQVGAFYLLKDLKNAEIDVISTFLLTAPGEAHTRAFKAALEGTLRSAASTLEAEIGKQKH